MENKIKISEDKKKNGKVFNSVLIVQFIAFGLLSLLLFISAKSNSDVISSLAEEYSVMTDTETDVKTIKSAYEKVSDKISSVSSKINENKIDKTAKGGVDIDITSEDINEGIFYDEYKLPFDIICPVDDYFVSSEFGARENPLSGGESIHTGIDLAASYGSDIYAVFDGTVRKADYSQGYGNYIVVTHSDGIETLYAHCSKTVAHAGDEVKAGDVIAKVGSTGNSTGNHLHFEIRYRNVKLNPKFAYDF